MNREYLCFKFIPQWREKEWARTRVVKGIEWRDVSTPRYDLTGRLPWCKSGEKHYRTRVLMNFFNFHINCYNIWCSNEIADKNCTVATSLYNALIYIVTTCFLCYNGQGQEFCNMTRDSKFYYTIFKQHFNIF